MTDKQNFAKDINVPSKEQIIIDGVDVSGCSVYKNGKCLISKAKCNARCDYAAIYLKEQLVRKTQECEELKEANQHINANRQCKGSKLKRIEELISACEAGYTDEFIQKIYGIIQESEPTINDYSITDRYRKALEEIEEVWEKDKDGDYDFVKRQILNIINEAKDINVPHKKDGE